MSLKLKLLTALGGLALLAGLATWVHAHIFHAGELAERQRWEKREADIARGRSEHYTESTRLGNRAAAAALGAERSERDFALQLTQERSHAVLTVSPAACPARPADRVAAAHAVPVAPTTTALEPAATTVHDADESATLGAREDPGVAAPADGRVYLTVDAVGLWNSALTGARELPAATCRTDAGAAVACAAGRALSVEDAWDNQAENALRCRIDRERYRQLTELLRQRDALQGMPHGQ